jgi:hypothetical protein
MTRESLIRLVDVSWLIVGPLLVSGLLLNLVPLIGAGIGFAASPEPVSWGLFGIFHYPEAAKPSMEGAFVAVNLYVVLSYLLYLRRLRLACRQNKLTVAELASLPMREQRAHFKSANKACVLTGHR